MALGIPQESGENLKVIATPPPIGGWNTRDALSQMPPTDAIELENWFPDTDVLRVRKGTAYHAKDVGIGSIRTLAELTLSNGTKKLIAVAQSGSGPTVFKFYDCSTAGDVAATDISGGSTWSDGFWMHVNFNGYIFFAAYGTTSDVVAWNGTGNVSSPAFEGPGGDDKLLCHITSFKKRLYFTEKDAASVWYGGIDQINGSGGSDNLTEFPVDSQFRLGGYIMFCSTTNVSGQVDLDTLFVIVSSQGEVLVYGGDYPADPNWRLVGHYFTAPPLGRRAFFHFGGTLNIITSTGIISTSELFRGVNELGQYNTISKKIDSEIITQAAYFLTNTSLNPALVDTLTWQGIVFPKGKFLLINLLVGQSGSLAFIMNLVTGAWCKFVMTTTSNCWSLFKENLYFGGESQRVMQAWTGDEDVQSDGTGTYSVAIKARQAYNYIDTTFNKKIVQFLQPVLKTDDTDFVLGINTDFQDTVTTNSVSLPGSGSRFVQPMIKVAGIGRNFSIRNDDSVTNVSIEWHMTNILYQTGGIR